MRWRHAWWVALFVLPNCSRGKIERASEATSAAPAPEIPSGPRGANGSIAITGALEGTFTWKPELALDQCACPGEGGGVLQLTMSDGDETFIAMRATVAGDLRILCVKLGGDALFGKGTPGSCRAGSPRGDDRAAFDLPIDASVKGTTGKTATVKGYLNVLCP